MSVRESSVDGISITPRTLATLGVNPYRVAVILICIPCPPSSAEREGSKRCQLKSLAQEPVFSPVPFAVVFQTLPSSDCWNETVTFLSDANL